MLTKWDKSRYENFLIETLYPWCWACGRLPSMRPDWWIGPYSIERAHIVNKPRVEDRRAVILLCTVCHRRQHGERLSQSWPAVTLAAMLWLKSRHDPEFYDRGFLSRYSIGRLPKAVEPVAEIRKLYHAYHDYPNPRGAGCKKGKATR